MNENYSRLLEVVERHRQKKGIPTIADLLVERMVTEKNPELYLRSIKKPLWLKYVAEDLLKRL